MMNRREKRRLNGMFPPSELINKEYVKYMRELLETKEGISEWRKIVEKQQARDLHDLEMIRSMEAANKDGSAKFKIGDKVIIKSISEWRREHNGSGDIGMVGIVISVHLNAPRDLYSPTWYGIEIIDSDKYEQVDERHLIKK